MGNRARSSRQRKRPLARGWILYQPASCYLQAAL